MARRAPKQSTPVAPQAQLDEIERQRVAQQQAYAQEQQLIQEQTQQQTSALQAMLNVYQRQAQDLDTTRQTQLQEQQSLVAAQEQQAKLIEADRISAQAQATNQQQSQNRVANRASRVISQRAAAKKSTQPRVMGDTSGSPQPMPTIFGRRRDLMTTSGM
jgi:hypothetical protein